MLSCRWLRGGLQGALSLVWEGIRSRSSTAPWWEHITSLKPVSFIMAFGCLLTWGLLNWWGPVLSASSGENKTAAVVVVLWVKILRRPGAFLVENSWLLVLGKDPIQYLIPVIQISSVRSRWGQDLNIRILVGAVLTKLLNLSCPNRSH